LNLGTEEDYSFIYLPWSITKDRYNYEYFFLVLSLMPINKDYEKVMRQLSNFKLAFNFYPYKERYITNASFIDLVTPKAATMAPLLVAIFSFSTFIAFSSESSSSSIIVHFFKF